MNTSASDYTNLPYVTSKCLKPYKDGYGNDYPRFIKTVVNKEWHKKQLIM
jgi:hypothetical protein